MPTAVQQREVFDLAATHTERFVTYLDGLAEAELELSVPGLEWTVGDVVAHVRSVYERYTADRRRASSADEVGAFNAEDVARVGHDVPSAIASIREQVARLDSAVDLVPPDQLFPFHAGVMITMTQGWGNMLGELLVHGDDIARATGRPFGIPSADLAVFWTDSAAALGPWFQPAVRSLTETWELRFDFGTTWLTLDDGAVSLEPRTPDHVIEAGDAGSFMLVAPYRRRVSDDPATALFASRFVAL